MEGEKEHFLSEILSCWCEKRKERERGFQFGRCRFLCFDGTQWRGYRNCQKSSSKTSLFVLEIVLLFIFLLQHQNLMLNFLMNDVLLQY